MGVFANFVSQRSQNKEQISNFSSWMPFLNWRQQTRTLIKDTQQIVWQEFHQRGKTTTSSAFLDRGAWSKSCFSLDVIISLRSGKHQVRVVTETISSFVRCHSIVVYKCFLFLLKKVNIIVLEIFFHKKIFHFPQNLQIWFFFKKRNREKAFDNRKKQCVYQFFWEKSNRIANDVWYFLFRVRIEP